MDEENTDYRVKISVFYAEGDGELVHAVDISQEGVEGDNCLDAIINAMAGSAEQLRKGPDPLEGWELVELNIDLDDSPASVLNKEAVRRLRKRFGGGK